VAVVSPCDLSVCTEPVVLKRPSRCEVMEGSEARGTCTTCRRRPRARTGCVLVTPPTFLRHHFSGDAVRQRLKARPHTPHRIFGAGATANWITKGKGRREEPGRTQPRTQPRTLPSTRRDTRKNVLIADSRLVILVCLAEERWPSAHPAHVEPRLGSPAPCTRGTRCSRTSPRQPNTQYEVSGRRGAAALPLCRPVG
jgi:hypothetical protein